MNSLFWYSCVLVVEFFDILDGPLVSSVFFVPGLPQPSAGVFIGSLDCCTCCKSL